jgi:quercetin dioxygenase-like cupin family protein
MNFIINITRAVALVFAVLPLLIGSAAMAAEHGHAKALALTHDDPQLEWGPCPEFLPQGCAIAVLHGDPAKENADIFFKVPGGAALPRHTHTSAERMVLVSGELHVTYDGQETVVLRPGTYAYGPAQLPHEGSCAAGDPCVLFIGFEEPVDAMPVQD